MSRVLAVLATATVRVVGVVLTFFGVWALTAVLLSAAADLATAVTQ